MLTVSNANDARRRLIAFSIHVTEVPFAYGDVGKNGLLMQYLRLTGQYTSPLFSWMSQPAFL